MIEVNQEFLKNLDRKSQNGIEELEKFIGKVKEQVDSIHTAEETNLWNLSPSDFCVLYNIDQPNKKEEFCYGYFVVNGAIMLKKSEEIKGIKSYGHLYLNNDDYLKIRKSYQESIQQ